MSLEIAFRRANQPMALFRPTREVLDLALKSVVSTSQLMCAHDDFAALRTLWNTCRHDGTLPRIVFYHGTERDFVRDFPFVWGQIHVQSPAPGDSIEAACFLAPSIGAGGELRIACHSGTDRLPEIASTLVRNGIFSAFSAENQTIVLRPAREVNHAAVPQLVEHWAEMRAYLHERYFATGQSPDGAHTRVEDLFRIFRRTWAQAIAPQTCGHGRWPYVNPDPVPLPPSLPDGMPWPRISVITPSFNQGRYIEETLLSVRHQDYPNLEHIVIDGGSTDDTTDVLARHQDTLAYVVSEKDRGQSHAINKGMAVATGDILTWLNSDDMLAPGALRAAALAFALTKADMVAGICELYRDGEMVGRHLTSCEDGPLPLDDILDLDGGWNAGQFFYQPEVFFSRDIWTRAGSQVDETLFYSMDYDLWLRFAERRARLHVIARPLAWFRLHPAQKTHEEKFKTELRTHRDDYLRRNSRPLEPSRRPPPDFSRRLKVVMLNDLGFQLGAGIAHARLASAIELAGHDVAAFALTSKGLPPAESCIIKPTELFETLSNFNPDLIIVGNVHAARIEPEMLDRACARWPTMIVLHDLWWLTGRCAYTHGCEKLLVGCDEQCPTPTEYPELAPTRIFKAWRSKRDFLRKHAPILLANSPWTASAAAAALPQDQVPPIERLTLGLPLDLFRPRDKQMCRDILDLPQDKFIILFSASSISDPRKGGQQVVDLIRNINRPDWFFLGTGDGTAEDIGLSPSAFRSLGYIEDPERLAMVYSAADIMIGPSREETFGQVFVEAIACGTPVVGHGVTGVKDAVRDGVTGLTTGSPTADGLEAAVLALYRQPWLRENLSRWGRIYVEETWSLEASYRSLFVALRRTGLVDKFGLPHKISLLPHRPLATSVEKLDKPWIPLDNISGREGPFPQWNYPFSFYWFCGPISRIKFLARRAGRYLIGVEYQNPFADLPVVVKLDKATASTTILRSTPSSTSRVLHFTAALEAGHHLVTFEFGHWREPNEGDHRRLALAVRDITIVLLEDESVLRSN